ncbi:MAG: endonuclease/exonuclease/phosphatase family protein [Balneolaceae bacterium]
MNKFLLILLLALIPCVVFVGCDLINTQDKEEEVIDDGDGDGEDNSDDDTGDDGDSGDDNDDGSNGDDGDDGEGEDVDAHTLNVMTFNIRGDKAVDGVNQWEYRKDRVADLIIKYEPAILGLQEARPPQLADLESRLYDYKTIGGGSRAGEYTVILYNTSMVEYIDSTWDFIWLSETPYQQSVGWDAKHVRILIYAQFRDLETGDTIYAFNTHYDHVGSEAREKSASLTLNTIADVSGDDPVILMGDFNHTEDERPYSIFTSSTSGLKNAYYESETSHSGPETRSSGFSVANHSNKKPIDFIFINDQIRVKSHAFIDDSHNGYYPSDHMPVMAEIEIISED